MRRRRSWRAGDCPFESHKFCERWVGDYRRFAAGRRNASGEEIATLPGLPLGILPEAAYEETGFRLEAGVHLTFVSDGVIEATSASTKELFGFERTMGVSLRSASVIAEAACNFGAGAPQADDITVLTIRLA